jgi:hypothetical protein
MSQKIVLALVSNIKDYHRLVAVLKEREQAGYGIHLLETEDLSQVYLDTLPALIEQMHRQYGEQAAISLLCNNKALLFAWYRRQAQPIADYLLYVEEEVTTGDQQIINDREAIFALNDFSGLQNIRGLKPIQVVFQDWEDIVALVVGYIAFICPYKTGTPSSGVVVAKSLDEVLQSDIFQDFLYAMNCQYGLPVKFSSLALMPYIYHNAYNKEILYNFLLFAVEAYCSLSQDGQARAREYIHKLLVRFPPQCKISLLSLAYEITRDKWYIFQMFAEETIRHLDQREKSVVFWQIKYMMFVGKVEFSVEEVIRFRKFYQECVDEVAAQVCLPAYQSLERRNKNRVMIITSQFLGSRHAPSRNVLDYSYHLKRLGKEVYIINAADILPKSALSFCGYMEANFVAAYGELETIGFADEKFPFHQANPEMPNLPEMQRIINLVHEFNPEFVIEVGDTTLIADVCSHFTTVVAIPCGGVLAMYPGCCWAVPRKYVPEDQQIFQAFGMTDEKVFPIHYTFLKKEKEIYLQRQDVNLPEEAFILCVVGNRLDEEVTGDFIRKMELILAEVKEAYIVFIGQYQNYEEVMRQHVLLQQRSAYLGLRSDIQSIYPLCNVYLNPKRRGGATSGAEALLEGLPVITLPYGDVYYQLWLDQAFGTTEEIIYYLKRCICDQQFYWEEKCRAKRIGEKLFDTAGMMEELLGNMEKYFETLKNNG